MIEDNLKKDYEDLIKKPNEVLSIFSDFYGEDKVDLQGLPSFKMFKDICLKTDIPKYFKDNFISLSNVQFDFVQDIINSKQPQYDYSFNNPEIFRLFYQNFIIRIIKNYFNDIFIVIHFPVINVTNEHNKSIEIREMYAKVHINVEGTLLGTPIFNRAEYTRAQLSCSYMHSHISSIDYNNLSVFKSSCLGSGPIRDTIALLNNHFDNNNWMLFCLELDRYLQVESLSGGPYKNLENVREGVAGRIYTQFDFQNQNIAMSDLYKLVYNPILENFIKYLINSKKLIFNFYNGSYGIGMSYLEFNIFISNEFITWYNKEYTEGRINRTFNDLLLNNILKRCMINEASIAEYTDASVVMEQKIAVVEKQFACTFKGKKIPIKVTNRTESDKRVTLLNPIISQNILTRIITIININYGTAKQTIDSTTGSASTSYRFQGGYKTLLYSD